MDPQISEKADIDSYLFVGLKPFMCVIYTETSFTSTKGNTRPAERTLTEKGEFNRMRQTTRTHSHRKAYQHCVRVYSQTTKADKRPADRTVTEKGEFSRLPLTTREHTDTGKMATAGLEKKVKDNFLTCSICFEMYTDPCTLRCDHTFCRKCVTSYIQTRPDAVQSKTIPCPNCRQDTKVPNPSSPVEEWAGQIKPSITIQGLIDTYRSEVAVPGTSSTCCTICQQLGETTPGVLWCPECEVVLCDKCVKTHRVTPISLNHDLCDLSCRSKVKRRIKCTEHKSNRVEFHCQDCGKAACQTCCIIYHRACKAVVTIESMKPRMKAALMEKKLGMEKRLKVRSKKVDIRNEKLLSSSRITKSAVQNIRLICQTAINKIKQKETQLLEELNNILRTYADQLRADVKLEEIEMQMYRQHCEFIYQALVSDCEMDLYDAYQVWESGAVEMEDVRGTEAADTRRIDDVIFTPDTDNVLKALDNLQLGKIDVTYRDQERCVPSLVLVDTMDRRMADDDKMATAGLEKKVKDNFLTCSICFEMYTDPCTLRCDHTFCRKCVTSYIQTRPDAVQSKTIPCPCCRQDTKVPHPSRPVEEWAGQIKASIVIQGLIDTYRSEVAVQETSSTCCTICQQLGETTLGVLWCPECEVALCDKCVKTHRVTPNSLNHDLCDLWSRSNVKRRIKCTEHKSNLVQFHCQDCGKAACQTCCIIYHRACKTVVTIESMKPGMKAALMEKRLGMEKRLKVRSKKVDIKQEKLQSNSRITESAVQNIRLICQTAINKIKQKETQLLDELNNTSQTYADQLQADVKLEEIEMQMYRQHCEFIDQALVSDCEIDLYDAYQAWESGAVEMEDVRGTEAADIRRIDDVIFTPDTDNVLKVLDNLQLGKIDVPYQDQEQYLPSPVLGDTIDGRMEGDEKDPFLFDVTVLVVDGVQTCVVTDDNNKCVKSFFTRNNHSCHSKLPLGNAPRGITQLNEKQVMVAVPYSHQIVIIEVTPDLVLLSTTKTPAGYFSLAVLNPSSLAAGTWECVDILDMAGHVLRSVTTYNDDSLFSCPFNMCVNNKGNLLVSDCMNTSVTCLTSGGDVLWRYAPTGDKALSYPCGITTTSTGDILVVDWDADKVIQLTESGEFVRELLTLEDGDQAGMCDIFCDKYGFLFLCTDTEVKGARLSDIKIKRMKVSAELRFMTFCAWC
ncbi:uncharacterized protein LOC124279579 [Haliotis rubra]|uniref:uncharacterized protein LOC124279579 n=1 Tax=Haliotis rubra TaxID=36100 RepID=UPI001EE60C3E|nr:uncharacterized protein LOC124279579 [Haliotis rubra]